MFALAAIVAFRRREDPPWLDVLRTLVTTYIIVSGIVFAVMVVESSSRAYRIDVPWSDQLLHFWIPAFALLDWLFDPHKNRHALAVARLGGDLPARLGRLHSDSRCPGRLVPLLLSRWQPGQRRRNGGLLPDVSRDHRRRDGAAGGHFTTQIVTVVDARAAAASGAGRSTVGRSVETGRVINRQPGSATASRY